uniref:Uncharacterized protein n=1 Tax=Arundo donax TaxID=35708 RepID=A0A0A9FEB6_ARUDO
MYQSKQEMNNSRVPSLSSLIPNLYPPNYPNS